YTTLGAIARARKLDLLERTEKLAEEFEKSKFNTLVDVSSKIGVITSSVSYLHTLEALEILNLSNKVNVLKLGTTYPLPKKLITDFLKSLSTVIVVEELSPFLEREVYAFAKDANPSVKVYGKLDKTFSEAWEYTPSVVVKGIAKALNLDHTNYDSFIDEAKKLQEILPKRFPTFCAGCPHRGTYVALDRALKNHARKGQDHFFANDIGCYSMWAFPPFSHSDSSLCMGASVGVANGLSHVIEERPVAVVGDSTFYHAALPGIVNTVHNNNKMTLIILDNSVTAMTGQQSNPSTVFTAGGKEGKKVSIEKICRAIGVEFVEVVDSYDVKENVDVFKRALEFDGFSIVISRRECALYGDRLKRRRGEKIIPYYIDKEICKKPYTCLRTFYCPAYELDADDQPKISPELCDGCSVCSKLCPFTSIKRSGM
ncbi:MAG: thiamine pyrophosphate-dependent enzyme, partial [Candidatus Ranarchaeia archaeon]